MHTNKKRVGYTVNPLITAVAGAVVGAGVAIAGAVAMADKKNQAKVQNIKNKTKNLGNIAKNTVKDIKNI